MHQISRYYLIFWILGRCHQTFGNIKCLIDLHGDKEMNWMHCVHIYYIFPCISQSEYKSRVRFSFKNLSKMENSYQGCYATWKTWRTWKSQGISYLTEKWGNFSIFTKILEKLGNLRMLMLEGIFMPTLKPNFWISCHI